MTIDDSRGDAQPSFFCLFLFLFFHLIYDLGRFFFLLFPIPFIISALLFLLYINSRDSDPGSHSRLFFALPATVRALHFYREKDSALPSLVDSHRIAPTHAIVGALDSWCHFRKKNVHMPRFEPVIPTLVVNEVNHSTTGATARIKMEACLQREGGIRGDTCDCELRWKVKVMTSNNRQ